MSAPIHSQGFQDPFAANDALPKFNAIFPINHLKLNADSQAVGGIHFFITRRRIAFVGQVDTEIGVYAFVEA